MSVSQNVVAPVSGAACFLSQVSVTFCPMVVKSFDPATVASFAFRQCREAPFYGYRMPRLSFWCNRKPFVSSEFEGSNRFSRQYQEVTEVARNSLQILAPRFDSGR